MSIVYMNSFGWTGENRVSTGGLSVTSWAQSSNLLPSTRPSSRFVDQLDIASCFEFSSGGPKVWKAHSPIKDMVLGLHTWTEAQVGLTTKATHLSFHGIKDDGLEILPDIAKFDSAGIDIAEDTNTFTYTDADGTPHVSSAFTQVGGIFYKLEIKIVADEFAGSCEIQWGGTPILNVTGINTLPTGYSFTCEEFQFGVNVVHDEAMANLYVLDGTAPLNDFLGTQTRIYNMPVSDVESSDFTPIGTTDEVVAVSATEPQEETVRMEGSEAGDTIEVSMEDLYPNGVVAPATVTDTLGVQFNTMHSKYDAGTVRAHSFCKQGGIEVVGPTGVAGEERYHHLPLVMEETPAGEDWSFAKLNDVTFGVEIEEINNG